MKKFLTLLIAVVLVLSLTACGGESKKIKNPETIMDLFDGEEKLWYCIDRSDSSNGLAYNCDVKAVFTTENKTVTSMFYNLIGMKNGSRSFRAPMVGIIDSGEPNPFGCERLLLSDFQGLSNEEVIDKVSAVYGDASVEYDFYYRGNYSFEKCEFPSDITYFGYLDSTGNHLENEKVYLFEHGYRVEFPYNDFSAVEYISSGFAYDSTIFPTELLDKTYIGIMDVDGNIFITENIYDSFGELSFDDPSGMREG